MIPQHIAKLILHDHFHPRDEGISYRGHTIEENNLRITLVDQFRSSWEAQPIGSHTFTSSYIVIEDIYNHPIVVAYNRDKNIDKIISE
jgi:hypothetical protein